MLETIELQTGDGQPDASVIWLHGLGADGHDFAPIVQAMRLPAELRARFVFPHAPVRPVTINMGMAMRAWYDILGLDLSSAEDADGIRASADAVAQLIAAERERGIRTERILLAGFSQGGAIATHLALRFPERLAGLLALSTYLPLRDSLAAEASAANRELPIAQHHGRDDPMIPVSLARDSCALLQAQGYAVEWREYPMQHEVCPQQILDLRAWFVARLATKGQAAHD